MGHLRPLSAILSLPEEGDSLLLLKTKLSSFLYVLNTGNCIAAATGYAAAKSDQPIAESVAFNEMRPGERDFFREWKNCTTKPLPTIDWHHDRGHTPSNSRPLKKSSRCAEALNRLYKTDRAEPCHYYFFTEHHSAWLPLITAVSRVIGAERNQAASTARLRSPQAQYHTLKRIVEIARQIVEASEDGSLKQQALETLQALDTILQEMESKRPSLMTSLGKRQLVNVEEQLMFLEAYSAKRRLLSSPKVGRSMNGSVIRRP